MTTIESDPAEGDFLTMHVYADTDGKRVYYPDKPMFRGIYTNNPHTLVRSVSLSLLVFFEDCKQRFMCVIEEVP